MMHTIACVLIAVPVAFLLYSYLVYPAVLALVTVFKPAPARRANPGEWPDITITVPCFNEERSIGATLESLLALDYPAAKRHVLVISDASTDGTDAVVGSFAGRGVELLRLPRRSGKTAAENAAAAHLRGEIVVNTDATIRILPGALKQLVGAFQDPTVGVASGRDVSVGNVESAGNQGESGYVGYEMWIRSLETRVGTIVGASGCFFATRRELYASDFPEALSRDFASCLIAREQGYRAVSVDAACALVPRASSLRAEYRRKIRTMARGLGTLHYKRHLLNPFRFGAFSFMLISHKLCRWLFQLTLPLLALGAVLLAVESSWVAPWVLFGAVLADGTAAAAWWWPEGRPMPVFLSAPGYFLWSNVAGLVAWIRFFRGQYQPVWEPTRRPEVHPG
jgi:cellulose synthase/poly-beta-1,6-N-acetylglucosamine synthase-like glycosyltransferase